ncbi:MAG: TolC family protein [Acidobacteriota bacterium]
MHYYALTGLVSVVVAVSGAQGPAGIAAESAIETSPVVTEAAFLSRLDEHPATMARSADVPLARADLLTAEQLENPVIELRREDPSGAASQTEWLLSWQPPGPSRRLEIQAAEKSIDAAEARVDRRLRALRGEMRRDYAHWAVASLRRELLQASAERLRTLAKRESARADKGESSGLRAHRLSLAVAATEARLSLAAAEVHRSSGAVRRWWPDLPPDARPTLPELPQPSTLGPPAGDGASTSAHPRIAEARAEAEAADLSRQASERFLEAPLLTLGWQRQESLLDDVGGPVIGVSWAVPIFDRRRAERRAAEARLETARAEAELAAREISARRTSALRRYEALVRDVDAAETAIEPSADMLAAAELSHRYGELPLTELLDIQRSVSDAQLARLDLLDAALGALRELEQLAPPIPTSQALPLSNDEDDSP